MWLALGGLAALVAIIVAVRATSSSEEAPEATVDGDVAMQIVEDLCRRGHRYYGAPNREQVVQHLRSLLDDVTDQTALQRFTARESVSEVEYELTNIIGRQNPEADRRFVLGTHWDTRLWAEEEDDPERRDDPIVGANDGTSGVAVLIELARALESGRPPPMGIDFVLFDGEEFGRPGSDDYCQGSRHFGRMLKSMYPRSRPERALVIDMVGDCDQQFLPELSSLQRAPHLVAHVWQTAARLGHGRLFASSGHRAIEDDHTALQKAGIPAALLIDYDYPHWHTQGDTVDKVCATSLERVGDVLLEVLLHPEEERRDE